MTELLEQAIATVKELPESQQDLAARVLLDFANRDAARVRLTDAQVAEVELAKREVRSGKVVTDAEMLKCGGVSAFSPRVQQSRPGASAGHSRLYR